MLRDGEFVGDTAHFDSEIGLVAQRAWKWSNTKPEKILSSAPLVTA